MGQYLYIDNKTTELKLGKNYLEIRYPGRPISSIPFHLINHITIACDLTISTNLIHKLASEGIMVTLLNSRGKNPATFCYSLLHGNNMRRWTQYQYLSNPDLCAIAARELMKKKFISYIRQIKRYCRIRHDLKAEGDLLIDQLIKIIESIDIQSIDSLLGLEGNAAKKYFAFYAKLMPTNFPFNGRNKRPPKDQVNALLSLTYTLFTSECARALEACGLDPAFGIYHQLAYSRPSAACDLVELFRTHADHFVWRLIAEQKIKPEHFGLQLNACILNKSGKAIYFREYFQKLDSCRQRFYRTARVIAHQLQHLNIEEIDYISNEIAEINYP